MSFLPIDQQKEADAAAQQQTTNFPAGEAPPTSGGSAGEEGGGPKTSAGGTPTQFGSSASKLGDYLSANAPQITNQANTITGNLNQQYGQLQGGITNAANQFGQQVQGGYAAPNQDVVNKALANPTQFTSNPFAKDDIKAFQAQYNNAYTGPQSFESTEPYGQIQGQLNTAVNQANLLGTQSGLQSYLMGQQKNPTRASTTLDSLLLRGNPGAQQQIQQAAGQFKALPEQFSQTTQTADQSVQAAQKAAEDARAYAQGQFGNKVTGFNKTLADELTKTQTQADTYNKQMQKLQADAQSGILPSGYGVDPKLAAFLQSKVNPLISQTKYTPTYNFANALPNIQMANAPTLNQAVTPGDFATYQALNQLSGNQITSPLNNLDPTLAGTYKTPDLPTITSNNTIASDLNQGLFSPYWTSPAGKGLTPDQRNQYLGLMAALNQYQGNPWYTAPTGQANPFYVGAPPTYKNPFPTPVI